MAIFEPLLECRCDEVALINRKLKLNSESRVSHRIDDGAL
ncbi:hypothetical protein MED121_04038 [Marinomonas sp. MED121]|nr:hypothetical protein MED121_04038 [Marinomonas sp. MED121]